MRDVTTVLATALLLTAPTGAMSAQEAAKAQFRSVNGMQMYYEVRGSGAPLVLLHGFFGCGQFWEPLLQQLSSHYRVVTPDLRGHGHSTNPSGQFTHRQSALDVFSLLDQLGIKQFWAMGLSTGGMTLLHMATQQRERVEGMVLIGATSYFPEPSRKIMQTVSAQEHLPPDVMDVLRRCVTRGDSQISELVSLFHQFKDSYDDMNFTPPLLQTITASTLIVHGDRDVLFPVDIPVEMYVSIPKSYLWIYPNGPHVVPMFGDSASQFLSVVVGFLSGDWEKSGDEKPLPSTPHAEGGQ